MTTIVRLVAFETWYRGLSAELQGMVDFSVTLLAEHGVGLKPPHTQGLPGARFGIRELRVQSKRHPMRIFYAFNPARQAVLIVAGDKKGAHDQSKWTLKMLAEAEALFATYLAGRSWERR